MTTGYATARHRLAIASFVLLLVSCQQPAVQTQNEPQRYQATASAVPAEVLTPTPTVTPSSTPTPSQTPTSTPSPTPTLTPMPTATALPVTVHGGLREARLSLPLPQNAAPCGVVDTLDFPLDPPDGNRASGGGQNFGAFRGRYGKYHAGEDWGMASGLNMGTPVHSIGHGRVTYAEPRGWNADKGVVILEHTFPDGTTILSFYGHLDPPSVRLDVGDCVKRGHQVGRIGRPTSPPHLHFEIRSHMPTQPGPGYWASDPAQAGWEPPSQYIWDYRMAESPGVQWVRNPLAGTSRSLGLVHGDTFVILEDHELVGVSIVDGTLRWRQPGPGRIDDAMIDAGGRTIYVIGQPGRLAAYHLSAGTGGSPPADGKPLFSLMWEVKLKAIGIPTLLPLPQGGVVVSVWQKMLGVSAEGRLLWESDFPYSLDDWALADDRLILTTRGQDADVWTVGDSGPSAWGVQVGGRLVIGETSLVYDQGGIYRLDIDARSADLRVALPRAYPGLGDMIALPDGGLLAAHRDRFDSRLLALNGDGTLRWQRSYAHAVAGEPLLLLLEGHPFALFRHDTGVAGKVDIFAVDLETVELRHIYAGGSGHPRSERMSALAIGDGWLLINIRGDTIVALDTRLALDAASLEEDSS